MKTENTNWTHSKTFWVYFWTFVKRIIWSVFFRKKRKRAKTILSFIYLKHFIVWLHQQILSKVQNDHKTHSLQKNGLIQFLKTTSLGSVHRFLGNQTGSFDKLHASSVSASVCLSVSLCLCVCLFVCFTLLCSFFSKNCHEHFAINIEKISTTRKRERERARVRVNEKEKNI